MLITWAGFGVTIDKSNETQESLTYWISVPKHSYHTDVNGEEMAGMHLAKRLKTTLTEMGIKRLTIKAKVRDEIWTPEKRDNAELNMRKTLYGSQY